MAICLYSALVGQPQSTGCRDSEVLEQNLWRTAMVRELQDRTGMEKLKEKGFFSQKTQGSRKSCLQPPGYGRV